MKLNTRLLSNELENFEKDDLKNLLRKKEYEMINEDLIKKE